MARRSSFYVSVCPRRVLPENGAWSGHLLSRCARLPLGWCWGSWPRCGGWDRAGRPCFSHVHFNSRCCWPVPAGRRRDGGRDPCWPLGLTAWPERRRRSASVRRPQQHAVAHGAGKTQQKRDFHCLNSAPICCPTSSPLTPMFQENRDSESDKFLLRPHERGEEQLRARSRAVVCGDDHSSGFRAAGPRGGLLSYPVGAGAPVCANSRTSSVSFLKPQQVS